MSSLFVLRLRPTIVALTVGLLCAVVLAITLVAYLRTGESIEVLVDAHLETVAEATETKVANLLANAPRVLSEFGLLAERDRLPADHRLLGELFVERMRQDVTLGWLGYADKAERSFTGGRRDQQHVLLFNHSAASVNGGTPSEFTISRAGVWTERPPENPQPYDPTTRGWFTDALEDPALRWLDPYRFTDGNWGVSVTKGVVMDGEVVGVLLADFFLTDLISHLRGMRIGETGRVYIVTQGGVVLGAETDEVTQQVLASMAHAGEARLVLGGEPQRMVQRKLADVDAPSWTVVVLVAEAELTGVVTENARITALLGLVALLAGVLSASWFSGLISGPIREMSKDLRRIAVFDLPDRPTPRSSVAEVRHMAEALDRTKAGLQSFSRYVPVGLVRQLLADGREAKLGGRHQDLTILFSDIEGFTPLVESTPAQIVLDALGEYNRQMNAAIEHTGGAVVQYMGDGLMAIFGAPTTYADHALRACEAALRMRAAAQCLVEAAEASGGPLLRTRIGVNTGDVLVGNIGAPERFAYSALGDAVNTSARLEGLNKEYGTSILVGEVTAAAVGDALVMRPVDLVRMKGKQLPVLVYELVGRPGDVSALERNAFDIYTSAFAAYRDGRFAEALDGFEAVDAMLGGDGASQSLAERCRSLITEPPSSAWNGTRVMLVK